MPLYYRGERLIPTPFVGIQKRFIKDGSDKTIGTIFTITLTGDLVPHKGSPTSIGTAHTGTGYPADETLANNADMLAKKVVALRDMWSEEGHTLYIYPCDETGEPWACNPKIIGLNFPEGNMINTAKYEITLETTMISGLLNGTDYSVMPSGEDSSLTPFLKDANESWFVEFNETPEGELNVTQHTFRLTHTVSAVGQRVYVPQAGDNNLGELLDSRDAWEWAREYVHSKLIDNINEYPFLSSDNVIASDVINIPSVMMGFNHIRNENIDVSAGSYSVQETWILSSGDAFEDYTATLTTNLSDGTKQIVINGTIAGLETIDYTNPTGYEVLKTKYEAASGLWIEVSGNLYDRASAYMTIYDVRPISTVVGHNKINGVINYTWTFDNRPAFCINNADILSESIVFNTQNRSDIFASLAIPGRASLGSILQDANLGGPKQKGVNINLIVEVSGQCSTEPPTTVMSDVNDYIAAWTGTFTEEQIFVVQDNISWNPRGSLNVVKLFELGEC